MGNLVENTSIGFIFFVVLGGLGFGVYKLYQLLTGNIINILQMILYIGLGIFGILVFIYLCNFIGNLIDVKVFKNE